MKIEAAARIIATEEVALGIKYLESLGFKVLEKDVNRSMANPGELNYQVEVEDEKETLDIVTRQLKVQPSKTSTSGLTQWVWRLNPNQWVALTTYVKGRDSRVWRAQIVDRDHGRARPKGMGTSHQNVSLLMRIPGRRPVRW